MGRQSGGIIPLADPPGRLGRNHYLALMSAFAPVANPDSGPHPFPYPLHHLCVTRRDLKDQAGVPGELEFGWWISHNPGVVNGLFVDDGHILGRTDDRAVGRDAGIGDLDHRLDRSEVGAFGGVVSGDGVELFAIVVRQVDSARTATTGKHDHEADDRKSHRP